MPRVYRLDPADRERLVGQIEAALDARSDLLFGVLYGSFLHEEAFRDIDLGIWTSESAGQRTDIELAAALSEALQLPVDVRRLNEAPVSFLFHALHGRLVSVRDERRVADLMERTAREYHDRAPRLRIAAAEAFAR